MTGDSVALREALRDWRLAFSAFEESWRNFDSVGKERFLSDAQHAVDSLSALRENWHARPGGLAGLLEWPRENEDDPTVACWEEPELGGARIAGSWLRVPTDEQPTASWQMNFSDLLLLPGEIETHEELLIPSGEIALEQILQASAGRLWGKPLHLRARVLAVAEIERRVDARIELGLADFEF